MKDKGTRGNKGVALILFLDKDPAKVIKASTAINNGRAAGFIHNLHVMTDEGKEDA